MLFIGAGYQVCLYDVRQDLVEAAMADIKQQLINLEKIGMTRSSMTPEKQMELVKCMNINRWNLVLRASVTRIHFWADAGTIKECLDGAFFVQECAPESLELKRKIFSKIDQLVENEETIIASSTSSFPSSSFSETMKHRGQVLVAHPVNHFSFCYKDKISNNDVGSNN